MKSSPTDLENLFKIVDFTHKFQQVKRAILATGENRAENDTEHSYQLALTAWHLIQSQNLNLDINKVIKYALTHDLVEVYAGDTPFHTKDQDLLDSKVQRETDAFERIKKEFSEFPEMLDSIEIYEAKSNPEAKFVYALDKILPVINIYLDQGKTWRRDKITYEKVRTKDEKVAISPEAQKIWSQFLKILEKNQNLFP